MLKTTLLPFVALVGISIIACRTTEQITLPGKLADGRVRLPNGWILSPAGKHVSVGELPLNMAISPDGQYILVSNNGTGTHSLSIVDTHTWTVVQTVPIRRAWIGLRWFEDGKGFVVSCGNDNQVKVYGFTGGRAVLSDSIVLADPWPRQKIWVAGLDVDFGQKKVFVVGKQDSSLSMLDLKTRTVAKRMHLPATPYTCLLSRNRDAIYVSLWGASSIAVVDPTRFQIIRMISVGDHPNEMIESPTGKNLFVANANLNTVSVVDLNKGTCT